MIKLLCIFIGGGLGSMCRYSISAYVLKSSAEHFPWPTFAVNTIGCLLIGMLMGGFERYHTNWLQMLLVTGFCGGFTTFSTFSNESVQLLRQGLYSLAIAYMGLSLFVGLMAAGFGYLMVRNAL